MRVVLTGNFSPWSRYSGGGQRSTHNLASALSRRGHEVSVVFTRSPWDPVELPTNLGYEVEWAGLLTFRGYSSGIFRLSSLPTVAQRVRHLARRGALVVHAQGEEAALLPRLRRSGPRFGLVVTPRYPRFPEGVRGPGRSSVFERLEVSFGDPKFLALGTLLRGADFCCPPSSFGAQLVADAYSLAPERVIPVHNGVPGEFLDHHWRRPRDARELSSRPLLFFGRFAHDKGLFDVVEAVARLSGTRALLVGRGPLEPAVIRRVAELGLSHRVEFHGWADHATLGRLLSEASLAVLPSREENFSLAVLSALAVGTPVVTTPVGGTPEVIDDGVTGRLVPCDDPTALSSVIRELQENLEATCEMAERGKARVREHFTWDRTAARFEEIYERTSR